MSSGLTEARFLAYARTQIADIDCELAQHRPHGVACLCGRDMPCATSESLRQLHDHYVRKITEVRAAADDSSVTVLPRPAARPSHRTARLREVLSGLPCVGALARRRQSPEGSPR